MTSSPINFFGSDEVSPLPVNPLQYCKEKFRLCDSKKYFPYFPYLDSHSPFKVVDLKHKYFGSRVFKSSSVDLDGSDAFCPRPVSPLQN